MEIAVKCSNGKHFCWLSLWFRYFHPYTLKRNDRKFYWSLIMTIEIIFRFECWSPSPYSQLRKFFLSLKHKFFSWVLLSLELNENVFRNDCYANLDYKNPRVEDAICYQRFALIIIITDKKVEKKRIEKIFDYCWNQFKTSTSNVLN